MTVMDMTFDDVPTGEAASPRAYRAVEGRVDRLAIIFFQMDAAGAPDLARPRLLGARTQYHKQIGTVISRAGTPGADEGLWAEFEPARMRYATLVLRYPTTATGKVENDASAIEFLPWDFGEPTFKRLHAIANQQKQLKQNLGTIDLRIQCTNSQKQYVEVAAAGPAIWRMKQEAKEKLLQRAQTFYDTVRIGREVSDAELRQRLGMSSREIVPEAGHAIDYNELMEQV